MNREKQQALIELLGLITENPNHARKILNISEVNEMFEKEFGFKVFK